MHKLYTLAACETVVLGGNIAGLSCALFHARQGEKVLLIEQGTCLYRDFDRAGEYTALVNRQDMVINELLPASCALENGAFHPDRIKRHGEALAQEHHIQLLYGMQAIHYSGGSLTAAHKSGLYAIACLRVYDCRAMDLSRRSGPRYYALHVMDDAHAVLRVPIPPMCPQDECYTLAFKAFKQAKAARPNLTLGRSGMECVPAEGFDVAQGIQNGLHCTEGFLNAPDSGIEMPELFFENPLYPIRETAVAAPSIASVQSVDVLVAGGGTAGAVAALSAARQGLKVLLLEMNPVLGGTATAGGVSIYWFGTRDGATRMIDERVDALYQALDLPRSKCLWNEHDVFLPDLKAYALHEMLKEAGVTIAFEAVASACLKNNEMVTGALYAQNGKLHLAHAAMTIDTTGDADIAMFAGAQHVYGGQQDMLSYWGSLAQYTTPASYRNNFSTMVHIGCPLDTTRFIIAGRLRGDALYDHGGYVALRESRHIKSLNDVTLESLLAMHEPKDTLYQCFSNYDPKGKLTAKLIYNGLLPPNLLMNVPRGATIPLSKHDKPLQGILVGGKAIGCTHDAFPGLRMQPDLQQQGFALGVLAAKVIAQQVPAWDATGVQEAIAKTGGQIIRPLPAPVADLKHAISTLRDDTPLEWLEMDPAAFMTAQPPVIACFLADASDIVPLLKQALQSAPEGRRLILSRLLLFHGDQSGTKEVVAAIEAMLAKTRGLPRREGPATFGQLLPDHGLMPEAVYLLNALAHADASIGYLFKEILERLLRSQRDYRDLRAGIYCYVECFAYVAQNRLDPAFAPMLKRLLRLPELSDSQSDPLLLERFAMLKLALGRALKHLSDPAGMETLRVLSTHFAAPIRLSAQMYMQ